MDIILGLWAQVREVPWDVKKTGKRYQRADSPFLPPFAPTIFLLKPASDTFLPPAPLPRFFLLPPPAALYLADKTPDSCLVMDRPSEGLKPKACSQRNRRVLSAEFHWSNAPVLSPMAPAFLPVPPFFAPLLPPAYSTITFVMVFVTCFVDCILDMTTSPSI